MAEEVTDLTEEGEEGDPGKKKKKKEKPPKEKKERKRKGKDEDAGADTQEDAEAGKGKDKDSKGLKAPTEKAEKKEREGGGSGGVILIMLLLMLILAGGIAGMLYFDLFSSRQILSDLLKEPLLKVIVWLDPEFSSVNDKLLDEAQARENQLSAREEKIKEREQDVAAREGEVELREAALEKRGSELEKSENDYREKYESTVPLHRRDLTNEELEDILSYANTFKNMSPEDAAAILLEIHTIQDTASILHYLGERDRASIMAAFEPEFAAEITVILITYLE